MKKANSSTIRDVDHYLANVPEPARATLQKIRATIRSAGQPEAIEAIEGTIHSPLVSLSQPCSCKELLTRGRNSTQHHIPYFGQARLTSRPFDK